MKSGLVTALYAGICTLGLASLTMASPVQAQEQEQRQVNLPAGPLGDSLQSLAMQFGRQIIFDARAVAGLTAPAVSGPLNLEQALTRVLAASSLSWEQTAEGVLVIRPRTVAEASDVWNVDDVVVSASRTPQSPRQVASSVSVITEQSLRSQQVTELKAALEQQPGVTVATTGGVGGTSAVYIRGAYPHHTLFIIDGVRMNDRAAAYNNFMGGADVAGYDRIEMLRGPQSPMYGSSAMGGVILSNTSYGRGEFQGAAAVSGGSFDTFSASAAARGSVGDFGYSASLGRLSTSNDLPDNGYKSWNYSTRLNYALPNADVGFTFRGQSGEYESIGSRFFYSPGVAETANYLSTLYADWRNTDTVTSRFILGYHGRKYDWIDAFGGSQQTNKRVIADWQTAWKASDAVELVVGANYEESDYEITGGNTEDTIVSGFLSGTWRATDTLTFNAGARHDDYESVGSAVTWRAGFAWMVLPQTKLRGTYGTGFAAPGSSDRYGVPAWGQLPNPDIVPEESTGWDVGVEHAFDNGTTLSVSYFDNRFTNLIDWQYTNLVTYEGIYANRGRASSTGVELGVKAQPTSTVNVQAAYTYLDAHDDDTGERLLRRPTHSFSASTWVDVTDRVTLGAGLQHTAGRLDTDGKVGDYTLVRAFGSYKVTDRLTFKTRVENLFDAKYDDTYGYAGLPRAAYVSLEWRY